ncbi:hypothetical protein [Azospirillum brasilense]|uniref:hypothetical protein n=1 Tax=Azospirillum brasilense TaxID=192 RepID=UPI001EDB7E77|nr:hypothetical protein [Azospirillum brasilense]UKJ78159.1 hypothetical protein H1Q64_32715 [Azospirillum brasilense]
MIKSPLSVFVKKISGKKTEERLLNDKLRIDDRFISQDERNFCFDYIILGGSNIHAFEDFFNAVGRTHRIWRGSTISFVSKPIAPPSLPSEMPSGLARQIVEDCTKSAALRLLSNLHSALIVEFLRDISTGCIRINDSYISNNNQTSWHISVDNKAIFGEGVIEIDAVSEFHDILLRDSLKKFYELYILPRLNISVPVFVIRQYFVELFLNESGDFETGWGKHGWFNIERRNFINGKLDWIYKYLEELDDRIIFIDQPKELLFSDCLAPFGENERHACIEAQNEMARDILHTSTKIFEAAALPAEFEQHEHFFRNSIPISHYRNIIREKVVERTKGNYFRNKFEEAQSIVAAQGAELTGAQAALAARDAELTGAQAALAAQGAELTGAQAALAAQGAELTAAQAALAARDAELTAAQAALAARDAELTGAQAALAARDAELTAAQAALAARDAELTAAQAALAAQGAELTGAQAALAAQGAELTGAQAALAARDAELTGAQAALAAQGAELTGAQAALAARDAELTGAQAALAAQGAELTGAQAALAARDAELTGAQAALAARDAELTGAQAALAAQGAELTGAQAALAARDAELTGAQAALAAQGAELTGAQAALAARDAELTGAQAALAAQGAELTGAQAALAARDAELTAAQAALAARSEVLPLGNKILSLSPLIVI